MKKKLSIVSPCYNEEGNVEELRARVVKALEQISWIEHEHIFVDNASQDRTVDKIKAMAAQDPRVKLIVNNRNFGVNRSGFHGLRQAFGDAVVHLASDLQDPPELLPEILERWREGSQVVYCIKDRSDEPALMFAIRKAYYWLLGRLSEVEVVRNFTGFGLYDKIVIDELRKVEDPYPYVRGLMAEFGFRSAQVKYRQPRRRRGITSNNFYLLYETAMLGITSYSKVPIRMATFAGFLLSLLSLGLAFLFLVAKLLFWYRFSAGVAPMLIGLFFFSSVQLFFVGVLGEYVASIHTRSMRRPLVIERERVNF